MPPLDMENYSSVSSAVQRIKVLLRNDKELSEIIEKLDQKLLKAARAALTFNLSSSLGCNALLPVAMIISTHISIADRLAGSWMSFAKMRRPRSTLVLSAS